MRITTFQTTAAPKYNPILLLTSLHPQLPSSDLHQPRRQPSSRHSVRVFQMPPPLPPPPCPFTSPASFALPPPPFALIPLQLRRIRCLCCRWPRRRRSRAHASATRTCPSMSHFFTAHTRLVVADVDVHAASWATVAAAAAAVKKGAKPVIKRAFLQ